MDSFVLKIMAIVVDNHRLLNIQSHTLQPRISSGGYVIGQNNTYGPMEASKDEDRIFLVNSNPTTESSEETVTETKLP